MTARCLLVALMAMFGCGPTTTCDVHVYGDAGADAGVYTALDVVCH